MMKPILFNTDMVRAILDGTKTVTRRLIKSPEDFAFDGKAYPMMSDDYKEYLYATCINPRNGAVRYIRCPYRKNDILYVRESVWQKTAHSLDIDGETKGYFLPDFRYAATDAKPEVGWNYSWAKRPSIHMPKEAARIFLKVTDVRVERLQEINYEDAVKEGISNLPPIATLDEFADLWNSTVDKKQLEQYGWDANPWVWVINFKQCENPKKKQGGK